MLEKQTPLELKIFAMKEVKKERLDHLLNVGLIKQAEYESELEKLEKDVEETREFFTKGEQKNG